MDTRTDITIANPCFGKGPTASRTIHLPVAPRACARTRFAENAPARPAMLPEEGVDHLDTLLADFGEVDMVSITGPGDPLSTPADTLNTLRLIRDRHPDLPLTLCTRGMGIENMSEELAALNISHVTLLVDAVSPEIIEKIYAWIRPSTKTVPLPEAARLLVGEQVRAVTALKEAGVTVKIHTAVYPGYNAGHVEEVARSMARIGADIMAVVPYTAAQGPDEELGEVSPELMGAVRDKAGKHIRLMAGFDTCGDAQPVAPNAGTITGSNAPRPSAERPNVAVVSSDGMDVDLHLGHAARIMIYGPREDGLPCLLEMRDAPQPGSGNNRWMEMADLLSDCFVMLTASAGMNPRQVLRQQGLAVLITEGNVEGTVDVLYGGGKKGKCKK